MIFLTMLKLKLNLKFEISDVCAAIRLPRDRIRKIGFVNTLAAPESHHYNIYIIHIRTIAGWTKYILWIHLQLLNPTTTIYILYIYVLLQAELNIFCEYTCSSWIPPLHYIYYIRTIAGWTKYISATLFLHINWLIGGA